MPPTLLIQVHAEEEFDWSAPFDRASTETAAVAELHRLQTLVQAQGATATYAVDWPVIQNDRAAGLLCQWVAQGVAEVGVHLHPWVNPPHQEDVSRENSFAGNLPRALELEKLSRLREAIEQRVGRAPRTFVAGRYGIGPNTPGILAELGLWVDGSATPPFSFTRDGGPNFTHFPTGPFRYDGVDGVLGVPVSGAFIGSLRRIGPALFPVVHAKIARALGLEGLVSRLGLLSRVRLSPEGFSLGEMQALTRRLAADGERIFSLSLHSTSLLVGGSPYSATASQVDGLLDRLDRYLSWFKGEFEGQFDSYVHLAERMRGEPAVSVRAR